MGAAFAEGMARYLEEHNYKVEEIVHINAYQASSIISFTKAKVTDYQIVGDPVINLSFYFNLIKKTVGPSGFIIGADKYKRHFSQNYFTPKHIHQEPIDSGTEFWESLNRQDYKDDLAFILDLLNTLFRLMRIR